MDVATLRESETTAHEPSPGAAVEESSIEGGRVVRYRVNSPQVISETVGGETIIVNLATGHYFNLQGTAVDVWDAVVEDERLEAVVARLAGRYVAAEGEIARAVEELLDELTAADLVVPEDDGDAAAVEVASPPPSGDQLPPFTQPVFATFTDMQDIILLDPVHEVDAKGWPHTAAGA
jgi:Coenzyme PQQ synthesis protein D (PqqD)